MQRYSQPIPTHSGCTSAATRAVTSGVQFTTGSLILNADDWGRDRETTVRTLDCIRRGTVSSVSAMVFMNDSESAADTARAHHIDAGLHLNLTTSFSGVNNRPQLIRHHDRVSRFLLQNRFNQILFHPGLTQSFEYLVKAQCEEFSRLYGAQPNRIDGHHHMHLCSNVLVAGLLPDGVTVRRNFSFRPGQKNLLNRCYRKVIDGWLARRYSLTDFFYSLPPLSPPGRLQNIFALADKYVVEVETHPINHEEHRFLAAGEIFHFLGDGVRIAASYSTPLHGAASSCPAS